MVVISDGDGDICLVHHTTPDGSLFSVASDVMLKVIYKVYYGHTAILLSLFLAIVLFFVYLKSYWLMSFGNDAFCTKKKHNVMHKILNLHCNRKS